MAEANETSDASPGADGIYKSVVDYPCKCRVCFRAAKFGEPPTNITERKHNSLFKCSEGP